MTAMDVASNPLGWTRLACPAPWEGPRLDGRRIRRKINTWVGDGPMRCRRGVVDHCRRRLGMGVCSFGREDGTVTCLDDFLVWVLGIYPFIELPVMANDGFLVQSS